MYLLSMNIHTLVEFESTMYIGCIPDKQKPADLPECSNWVIMYLGNDLAQSNQIVGSILRISRLAMPTGEMILA
jgi:hypothetical protein